MKTTNRHILRWQIAIQQYRGNMNIIYKEGKSPTIADGLRRWPLSNVKRNPAYEPKIAAKMLINLMKIDRRKNFKFPECAPEFGTSDQNNTKPEGTQAPILAIFPSEMHNEFLIPVTKTYSKHKQCRILLQLCQQKYRSTGLEYQLEGP
ncbi:hypothetical protein O181_052876, partial [Austropuccinia psidii MF-1]|nr:hypothetical protein [Austropuccinia psidii MF-1]